jgi:tetratricopeptide (TPR) repeat protein
MPTLFARLCLSVIAAVVLIGCSSGKLALPIGSDSSDETIDNAYFYYLESQELIRQNQLDRAVDSLQRAVDLDPKSLYLKRELANLYAQQGKVAEALTLLTEIVAEDPEDADAFLLLGRIYQNQNQLDKAKGAYEEAIAAGEQDENVYLVLGNLYFQDQQYDDAEAVFAELVEQIPDSYAGYFFLGRVYAEKGSLDAAEKAFVKALSLEPELESARFELIDLLRRRKDTPANRKRIVELYKGILEQDAFNVQAAIGLAAYYNDIGNPKAAEDLIRDIAESVSDEELFRSVLKFFIERDRNEEAAYVLETLLKIKPGNSDYHFLAGLAFERLESVDKALWHYQRVSPNSQRYRDAVLQATLLYHNNGRSQDAIDYLSEVIEREPDNAELRLYMGQLYEESGDLAAAEKELLKAIDLAPENDKTYFELAVLYDKMNRKEASIATMKKVLEISPDHANALNYLGYTYADLGIQLDEAEAMIKKAMELKPGDGYFTDSLGWVYYQKGLYDKALEVLLEAHRLAPEDPIIMEHVGDAYRMLGDSKRALEYYRRSLEAKEDDREGLVEKIRMMEAQPAGDKDPS